VAAPVPAAALERLKTIDGLLMLRLI